jgi:hypothetical protein
MCLGAAFTHKCSFYAGSKRATAHRHGAATGTGLQSVIVGSSARLLPLQPIRACDSYGDVKDMQVVRLLRTA